MADTGQDCATDDESDERGDQPPKLRSGLYGRDDLLHDERLSKRRTCTQDTEPNDSEQDSLVLEQIRKKLSERRLGPVGE